MRRGPVTAGILYTGLVALAELLLGNAGFAFSLWHFALVPTWAWSVPVHAAGFLLLLGGRAVCSGRPVMVRAVPAFGFFAVMEALNYFRLHLFSYRGPVVGCQAAFWMVLSLYAALCTVISWAMNGRRRPAGGLGRRHAG